MVVYACTMIATLLITTIVRKKNTACNYTYITSFGSYKSAFFAMLPLTALAISRWNVGVDSVYGGTYWNAYRHSMYGDNILGFEPLFFSFMKICAKINMSFWLFLAIHAIIFMCCSVYAIKRGSVSTYTSILLFFSLFVYFDSYSSLRQSLSEALCMILISIMLTEDESKKKDVIACLLLALACGFHSISIIYIPIYFLCKMKFSRKGILVTSGVAIAAYPILQKLFSMIMRFFFAEKYSFIGVAQYNLLLSFMVFAVCAFYYYDICLASKFGYKIVILSLIIFVVMLNSGALLLPYRCFDCLKICYVFIVPMIVKSIKNGKHRFVVAVLFTFIFGYWFVNAFFIQKNAYFEYKSIFDNISVTKMY